MFDMLHGGGINPLDLMILESDEKRKKLESAFEQAVQQGYNPNDIQDQIYAQLGFGPNDLLETDRYTLKTRVEALFRRYNM